MEPKESNEKKELGHLHGGNLLVLLFEKGLRKSRLAFCLVLLTISLAIPIILAVHHEITHPGWQQGVGYFQDIVALCGVGLSLPLLGLYVVFYLDRLKQVLNWLIRRRINDSKQDIILNMVRAFERRINSYWCVVILLLATCVHFRWIPYVIDSEVENWILVGQGNEGMTLAGMYYLIPMTFVFYLYGCIAWLILP